MTIRIYKMIVTKVPLPDRDHCTRLNDLSRFIAIEKYRTNYIAFENEPVIVDNMIESGERPILNSKDTCIGALFENDAKKIHRLCKSTFFKEPAERSALIDII